MASLGKKILSAFVEVAHDEQVVTEPEQTKQTSTAIPRQSYKALPAAHAKFKDYFNKLFSEANMPGPAAQHRVCLELRSTH